MKKFFKNKVVIVMLVLMLAFLSYAAAPYYMTLIVRTALIDYGTLAVTGTSTFTGAATFNGGTTIAGNSVPNTVGTRTDGSSTYYWKGIYGAEYFLKAVKFLDSTGVFTSLGSILSNTIGTLDLGSSTKWWKRTYSAEYYVKSTRVLDSTGVLVLPDSGRAQGNWKVNGLLKVGNSIAKLDSFSTTDATKMVQWSGMRTGDILLVMEYTPAYSASQDTVAYTYITYNDSVQVTRAKTSKYTNTALKSGGIFDVVNFSKQ